MSPLAAWSSLRGGSMPHGTETAPFFPLPSDWFFLPSAIGGDLQAFSPTGGTSEAVED